MSAAAADAAPAPAKTGKKKLILIVAAAVLLLGGGGGTFFVMKQRAAAAAAAEADSEEAEEGAHGKHAARPDVKNAPTFVPLDPFTVNLADRDAERYAQVGMTLELADPKAGDLLKAYMPAIRNNILLVLSSKTAGQLIDNEGKVTLATEVRAAALKPLGYSVEPAASKKKAKGEGEMPIRAVHFSNFIVQ